MSLPPLRCLCATQTPLAPPGSCEQSLPATATFRPPPAVQSAIHRLRHSPLTSAQLTSSLPPPFPLPPSSLFTSHHRPLAFISASAPVCHHPASKQPLLPHVAAPAAASSQSGHHPRPNITVPQLLPGPLPLMQNMATEAWASYKEGVLVETQIGRPKQSGLYMIIDGENPTAEGIPSMIVISLWELDQDPTAVISKKN